ncbi:myelin gene regulatory factor-like A isoform X1 [Scylla paramamosain]|uniref:myelin gene regulatory factor-like A isoform X1 n=2 Tax=Scylla paramamosain TaxID=85552 RepID=UPI003083E77E
MYKLVMLPLLILTLLVHKGDSAMGALRQFGPYGHPPNNNNNPSNNNNNYNYNNHIYNQPTVPHHNSLQNQVKIHDINHNRLTNQAFHNHNPDHHSYQHSDCHNHDHHQQQYQQFKGQEEKRKFEDAIRKIFSKRKMETTLWDRLFGPDDPSDLENDLTTLHDLSAKFGVYHLLPDDLKTRRDDLTRSPSSYTSYMGESQDAKGFPGMDFYSLFAFAIFFSTLTYAIFFLLQQEGEGEKRQMESSAFSVLQESLVRVVTDALERWSVWEEEEEEEEEER